MGTRVEDVIREHVQLNVLDGESGILLRNDTNLIDQDVLDSLGIFTLTSFLVERFGVQIEPDDVTLENFETVGAISQLVRSKQVVEERAS